MKKVGIVTLQSVTPNYGNTLQSYAVHRIFSGMGYDSKTLKWKEYYNNPRYVIQKNAKRILSGNIQEVFLDLKRSFNFKVFNAKKLPTEFIDPYRISSDEYDYYVVGSDQVWNPLWYNNTRKRMYLLEFAKDHQKICMSPSFGIDAIPEKWKDVLAHNLNTFPVISVREESGAAIIRELTGKTAEVLIDPTLIVECSDWVKIMKQPRILSGGEKYIATYFLDGQSATVKEYIQEVAREKNLKIISLFDYQQPKIYAFGPREFVYTIANAEIVMTDSYHASVFSFLFNRPFLVFDRKIEGKSMNSRLETFLSKFNLKKKYVDGENIRDIWEHDYEEGYKQLEIERKKAMKFLKEVLGV